MTKLFQLLAGVVLLVTVGAAQQAAPPQPSALQQQQAPEWGDLAITSRMDEPGPAVAGAGGPLVINPTFDAALPAIRAGNGAVRNANMVTITTVAAHRLTGCTIVTITGVADGSFNGTFAINVATPTSFTYAQAAPNSTSGGGSFTINGASATTAAQRAVIQRAMNDWQAVVLDSGTTPNPYPVSVRFMAFAPACNNPLAVTNTFTFASGDLGTANMSFNTNFTFYEGMPDPPTGSNTDLLSVARHELGHALGWTASNRVNNLMVGSAFNPPRLNIPIATATGVHVNPTCAPPPDPCPPWVANDLMVPAIGSATRRSISLYPAASLVARAYEYRIPMQYVDPMSTGTETGTAVQPWQRVLTACAFSPLDTPLLLSNATHLVPAFFRCANRHVVNAARGGAVVRP